MAAQELTARETLLAFTGLAIALLIPMYGTGFYASQFREGELVASWHVGIFFSVLWSVLIFVFFRNRKVFLKTATRVSLLPAWPWHSPRSAFRTLQAMGLVF